MRPPNVRPPRALPGQRFSGYDPDARGTAIRPLDVADIEALLAMPRPTRVRLVVFDPRTAGVVLSTQHFHKREDAIAASGRIEKMPCAVVVDGPDR